jgi:hypothetical protein
VANPAIQSTDSERVKPSAEDLAAVHAVTGGPPEDSGKDIPVSTTARADESEIEENTTVNAMEEWHNSLASLDDDIPEEETPSVTPEVQEPEIEAEAKPEAEETPVVETEEEIPPVEPVAEGEIAIPDFNPFVPTQPEPISDEIRQQYVQKRQALQSEVERHYTMSDEETQQFNEAPEKVLPKLAGRLYMDIYDSMMSQVQHVLPQILQGMAQTSTKLQSFDDAFFGHFKELDKKAHYAEYTQLMGAISQANPSAPVGEIMNLVGSTLITKHKLAPRAQPAAPVKMAPAYKPAAARQNSQVNSRPTDSNPFAALADSLMIEDIED